MSTNTQTFQYAELEVEAGIKKFDPAKPVDIEEKYLYCVASDDQELSIKIAGHGGVTLKDDARLCKREQKLLHRILVKQVASKHETPIIPIDSARFLIRQTPKKPGQTGPLGITDTETNNDTTVNAASAERKQQDTKYSAILISWNGRGSPPEDLCLTALSHSERFNPCDPIHEEPFKRVWNRRTDSTTSRLRFHWTKVILCDRNDDFDKPRALQGMWDSWEGCVGSSEFTLHHVPCKIYEEPISLRDALLRTQNAPGQNNIDVKHWSMVVDAFLKAGFCDHESFAVHEKKFYDLDKNSSKNKSMHGLLHCIGKHRELRLNDAGEPQLIERVCVKLFFSPCSVAEFMEEYFGKDRGWHMPPHLESLQIALRGKLVCFKVDGTKIIKAIESVSSATGETVNNEDMHPSWRGKIGLTLQHPDLPLINVGTKFRPALLPPEKVMLVPGQSFKRPFTADLRRQVVDLRQQHADSDLETLKIGMLSYVPKLEKPATITGNAEMSNFIQQCQTNQTQLSFITVGVQDVESPLWSKFQASLRKVFKAEHKGQVAQSRTTFLQHKPGEDVTKFWEKQLLNIKKGGGNPITIVVLRDDKYHTYLYKTIKTLCDTKIGLRTSFLKLNMLEQKLAKVHDTGRAAEMTAKVIAKKTALRNPKESKPLEADEPLDLTVAVHIERITINAPKPKPDGTLTSGSQAAKTVYIMVFQSRDTEKSGRFCTKTELIGPEKIQKLALAERVSDFVKDIATKANADKALKHRVVIFRSGYIPQSGDQERPTGRQLPSDEIDAIRLTTDMNNKDIYSVDDENSVSTRAPLEALACRMNTSINNEVSKLTDSIKTVLGRDTSLSYVHISKDRKCDFTESTRRAIGAVQVQRAEEKGTDPRKESFFITDTRLNPGQTTLVAPRNVHVQTQASLLTLTLLGDPIAEDKPETVAEKQQIRKLEPKLRAASENFSKNGNFGSSPKNVTPRSSSTPGPRNLSSGRQPLRATNPNSSPLNESPSSGSRRTSVLGPVREGRIAGSPQNKENMTPDDSQYDLKSPAPVSRQAKLPSMPSNVIQSKKALTPARGSKTKIMNSELVRLAKLWYDDRLELYNTKLPIPTHLAHLAAKRAQLHMRFDNFEDDADDTAPCALDPVHEDVKDTLYFL